ncbi:MAG TPA: metal-dependent hydrolase [Pyrinomonadaceae bacterium]|nr:metal-dependent hydrolase [Pyrinomonadaceae bacterium]
MENLTHSLVGLAAAKAGLERLSPGATALCIVAANAPDADVVTTLWGRWVYLHHHRGITHSIVGVAGLALLLPLLFYGAEKLVALIRGKPSRFRLRGLLIASLLATATHPLLDWTNNYGVRPLLPWDERWIYGDLVFIVDPWLWLVLGGACFLLTKRGLLRTGFWTLLGLVLSVAVILLPLRSNGPPIPLFVQVGWTLGVVLFILARLSHMDKRFGSRIAVAALLFVPLYWGALGFMHSRAANEANRLAGDFAARRGETVRRLAAMPSLADPTLWRCVAETDGSTFLFNLDLNRNPGPLGDVTLYEKPSGEAAQLVADASRDERARVFLNFARFPVAQTRGDCLTELFVQFADLRYTEPVRGARGSFALEVPIECPPQVSTEGLKK